MNKAKSTSRRDFFKKLLGLSFLPLINTSAVAVDVLRGRKQSKFKLSLSQWAVHRAIFGGLKDNQYNQWKSYLENDPDKVWQGALDPLDFPAKAREMGFAGVDYVNTCFFGHARDPKFLLELRKRSEGQGTENVVLMVDEEGMLANTDEAERKQAVESHKKWFDAGQSLGCQSVRVNLHGFGPAEDQMKAAVASLKELSDYADRHDVNLIIENHGGMSGNPEWLLETIKEVGHEGIGTMVDTDNFFFSETNLWDTEKRYNRYKGVEMLMPLCWSVSIKTKQFDTSGEEVCTDFGRMIRIIDESGYDGYLSIEYEGDKMSEDEGIRASKSLINRKIEAI